MRPGKYDLELYRGDTYGWQFKLWEDVDKVDAADLTGVDPRAQIRDASTTSVTALATVVELVCTVTLPNIVNMSLPATLWTSIPILKGVWDLELTYADGTVLTIMYGAVTVTADVTHA